jgi:hypothetical protein
VHNIDVQCAWTKVFFKSICLKSVARSSAIDYWQNCSRILITNYSWNCNVPRSMLKGWVTSWWSPPSKWEIGKRSTSFYFDSRSLGPIYSEIEGFQMSKKGGWVGQWSSCYEVSHCRKLQKLDTSQAETINSLFRSKRLLIWNCLFHKECWKICKPGLYIVHTQIFQFIKTDSCLHTLW